jgi:hypothetical protein
MGRQWAKRETQILSVLESTVGMVDDLQPIAGKARCREPEPGRPVVGRGDRPSIENGCQTFTLNFACPFNRKDVELELDAFSLFIGEAPLRRQEMWCRRPSILVHQFYKRITAFYSFFRPWLPAKISFNVGAMRLDSSIKCNVSDFLSLICRTSSAQFSFGSI